VLKFPAAFFGRLGAPPGKRAGLGTFAGPQSDKIHVGIALRDESTAGSVTDGSLLAFIPDPSDFGTVGAGTSASGIAADAIGNVYAADVGAHKVRKYLRHN
jgi:hypothetical protein